MDHKNNQSQLYHLLLLLNTTNLVFSLGKKIFNLLPDIKEFFTAGVDLTSLGLPMEEIEKLRTPNCKAVDRALLWMEQDNHHIISICDDRYPKLLKEIQNPPVLLFIIGDINFLQNNQIAIVGSRNPTPIGVEMAKGFARDIANVGITVTSGFASGIDAAAHGGAIDERGKTIAIMGTGLNHVYPKSQTTLFDNIIEHGGSVISEFPLDDRAKAWHFPLRNRIISGLSLGTLVVEAAIRSGSLITARLAGEQGREVFAVPGSIHNSKARGCNYLIRQGAKLVERVEDILEEFSEYFLNRLGNETGNTLNINVKNKLDCEHNKLLDCMGFERVTVDILASRAKLSASRVSTMLLELEVKGLVTSVLGGYLRIY